MATGRVHWDSNDTRRGGWIQEHHGPKFQKYICFYCFDAVAFGGGNQVLLSLSCKLAHSGMPISYPGAMIVFSLGDDGEPTPELLWELFSESAAVA